MNVRQLTKVLESNAGSPLHMMLPSGEFVPDHFHITEVGRVQKNFIDCGGTRREAASCMLQVWTAHDVEHGLVAGKLAKIFHLAGSVLGRDDLPVEIEYGADVASQFYLADVEVTPGGLLFVLAGKQTDCLAKDKCGVGECQSSGCCQ
jgi:hypothetical protein